MMKRIERLILRLKDRFTRNAQVVHEKLKKEWLFQSELEYLVTRLHEQTFSNITYNISPSGKKVHIYCEDSELAEITIFPKGMLRRKIYIGVRLHPLFVDLHAWFQLAFVGHTVRLRKPILSLGLEYKK